MRRGARQVLVICGALLAGLVPACSDCVREKCAYPTILLAVTDAVTSLPITGARAEGSGPASSCQPGMGCTLAVVAGGTGTLVVSADGYKSATVPFDIGTDDCGNPVRQSRQIRLQPTSVTAASEAGPITPGNAGCDGD